MFRYFTFVIILFFFSCQSALDETVHLPSDKSFFPLDSGFYRTYSIREIKYSTTNPVDTSLYFIKEVMDNWYISGGDTIYKSLSFKKHEWLEPWKSNGAYTIRKTNNGLITTKNNLSVVTLLFPIEQGTSWDANTFNTLDTDEYTYTDVYQPFSYDTLSFPTTIKVLKENNEDSIVSNDYRWEIYTKDVGLIVKQEDVVNFCTENECLGQAIIETGYRLTQQLVDYGYEN